jgi:hypothetical protein
MIIPVWPNCANALLFGFGTHTATLHCFPVDSFADASFDSRVFPITLAHTTSLTNSPHSLPLFLFVVSASLEGMIALSGADRSSSHLADLNSGIGVGLTKILFHVSCEWVVVCDWVIAAGGSSGNWPTACRSRK